MDVSSSRSRQRRYAYILFLCFLTSTWLGIGTTSVFQRRIGYDSYTTLFANERVEAVVAFTHHISIFCSLISKACWQGKAFFHHCCDHVDCMHVVCARTCMCTDIRRFAVRCYFLSQLCRVDFYHRLAPPGCHGNSVVTNNKLILRYTLY